MSRDQYQTVKEVADRLQVGEATVRGWIKDGELRAIEIGKVWRIADNDLTEFLSGHETRARHIDVQMESSDSKVDSSGEPST